MLLGIGSLIVIRLYAPSIFWWLLPVTIGLVLSVPISVVSSRVAVGKWFEKHKYFIIPEESDAPHILRQAEKYAAKLSMASFGRKGVELVVSDSIMNAVHLSMLPSNGPAPEFSKEVLQNAQIKLENYLNHGKKMELNKEEELALLYDAALLTQANVARFLKA